MTINKSDIPFINSESANQTLSNEISLEDLGSIQGGSALDHLQVLKTFKTKRGAWARLDISLMNNFINEDEYNLLNSGIKDDPYWQ